MPQAARTPDERFVQLPGYDYAPRYLEGLPGFEDLRLHYIDEGPADASDVYLCLHGEPTWAYLYRKMVPVFVEAGARVVAMDYFGFGRSDKPVDDAVYTFDFHRNTVLALIRQLGLSSITLVCQDWGGLVGLTLPMEMPERFRRLLIMNTALATGQAPSAGFNAWKTFVASQPDLDVGALMKRSVDGLTDAEAAAYDAPFPDAASKAGVRTFPQIVPVTPEMPGAETSRRAAAWLSTQWSGQSFMAVGKQDPVLGMAVMQRLRETIRGCPEPMEIPDAGHFVQEHGVEIAQAAVRAFT